MQTKKYSFFIVVVSFLLCSTVLFAVPELIEKREYKGTDGKWYTCYVYQDSKSNSIFTQVFEGNNQEYDHYNGKKFPNYPMNGGNNNGSPAANPYGLSFDINFYATSSFIEVSSDEDITVDITDMGGMVVLTDIFVPGTGNYVNIQIPSNININNTYGFIAKQNGSPVFTTIFRFDGSIIVNQIDQ